MSCQLCHQFHGGSPLGLCSSCQRHYDQLPADQRPALQPPPPPPSRPVTVDGLVAQHQYLSSPARASLEQPPTQARPGWPDADRRHECQNQCTWFGMLGLGRWQRLAELFGPAVLSEEAAEAYRAEYHELLDEATARRLAAKKDQEENAPERPWSQKILSSWIGQALPEILDGLEDWRLSVNTALDGEPHSYAADAQSSTDARYCDTRAAPCFARMEELERSPYTELVAALDRLHEPNCVLIVHRDSETALVCPMDDQKFLIIDSHKCCSLLVDRESAERFLQNPMCHESTVQAFIWWSVFHTDGGVPSDRKFDRAILM